MLRAVTRRQFLAATMGGGLMTAVLCSSKDLRAAPRLRVTGIELLPVRATERTVWLIVRLRTDAGLTGLGEASDAFGIANTTKQDAARMESELHRFFALIEGKSPLDIGAYRQQAERLVTEGGLVSPTAYSAIEQALWDIVGNSLDVPTYALLGGKVRDSLQVYANVNRATKPRTPAGFAAAALAAVGEGFRAVKAAPFDGFPSPGSPPAAIETGVEAGIASVAAMRDAVGPDVELMVDCHSYFDVALAERVAHRLEPYRLAWYEEPVPPEKVEETREIRRRINQPMAGREILFGVAGFTPLIRNLAKRYPESDGTLRKRDDSSDKSSRFGGRTQRKGCPRTPHVNSSNRTRPRVPGRTT
jgi:galactonate dehydratase